MPVARNVPEAEDVGGETLARMSKVAVYNRWLYGKIAPYIGKRIVEVGSGIGNMSEFLLGREQLFLTDLDPDYREQLRCKYADCPQVDVLSWDLEEPPPPGLGPALVDTVVCLNVLEHVKNDEAALRNMAAALECRGRLLLMVPAVKILYGSLDRHLHHHRRYGRAELDGKMREAGFAVERMFYMNFMGMIGWFVNSRLFGRTILSTRQLFLFSKLAPIFIALEGWLPIPVGLSLVAIGRVE